MDQPKPEKNHHPDVWPQVIEDMKNRHKLGMTRYGTALQPFNGRNSLQDLYEELLDACAYIKCKMMEEDEKKPKPKFYPGQVVFHPATGWTIVKSRETSHSPTYCGLYVSIYGDIISFNEKGYEYEHFQFPSVYTIEEALVKFPEAGQPSIGITTHV